MREELKNHFSQTAYSEMHYGACYERWMEIIDEFFDQYQPERLNPEDASNSVCDSLNSVETRRRRPEAVSSPFVFYLLANGHQVTE